VPSPIFLRFAICRSWGLGFPYPVDSVRKFSGLVQPSEVPHKVRLPKARMMPRNWVAQCEERVSIGRIEEYLERKRWEYLTASKKQKGRILDEVWGALHYHRKAAVRTLRSSPG